MNRKRYRILLVAHDDSLEKIIREACQDDPAIEIRKASGLAEGVRMASEQDRVVIIAGDRLPEGRGVDILLKSAVHPAPAVIIVAEQPDLEEALEAFRAGAKDYLPRKDFNKEYCRQALYKILNSYSRQSDDNRHRLFQTLQREIALALSAATELTPACREIVKTLLRLNEIDSAGLFLANEDYTSFEFQVHEGVSEEFSEKVKNLPVDSPPGLLLASGNTLLVRPETMVTVVGKYAAEEGLKSLAAFPVTHESLVVAALCIASHTRDQYSTELIALMESITAQISAAIVRIKAEEDSNRSRKNLQTMFNSLDDFILVLDGQGRILDWNPVVEKRLGYPPEELRFKSCLELHDSERREEGRRLMVEAFSGDNPVCLIPLQTRSGDLIPVEPRVCRGDWDGETVFFSISRDIQERMTFEQELRESEETLRLLSKSTQDAIIMLAQNGCISFWNDAAYYIFGYTFEEVIGKDLHRLLAPARYLNDGSSGFRILAPSSLMVA